MFVPIILSSAGVSSSFFTSEMTLTNRGSQNATINFNYTSALGGGSGTASDSLAAGKQRIFADTISYLRSIGVPIPTVGDQGGTLTVSFSGSSGLDGSVTVRTTTRVPGGRAGLAYEGIPASMALAGASYLPGLRQNSTDRSNVALQNAGEAQDGDITLRLRVFSGNPAAPVSLVLPDIVIPPGGFRQISNILAANGLALTHGYVRIERVSGTAPYYAFAVINDNFNSDGSFVPPILENFLVGRTKLTLPVVVATNWSSARKTLRCNYVADAIVALDSTASFTIELNPQEQLILPDFVQRLRDSAIPGIGPQGPSFVGAMFAEVTSGDLDGISLAARTSAVGGGGGRYGLFYGAVPNGLASTTSAWIYALQQSAETRSNLALVNTGETDGSADVFRIELFDGETGMKANTFVPLKQRSMPKRGSRLGPSWPSMLQEELRAMRE